MIINLSPYEKDRIIPMSFGLTEMGRDLLAEDYILKQITASLIYPEDALGQKFWKRVFEESRKRFGTTNALVNTFNKVWILPEKAEVYENSDRSAAYIVKARLKVMLEEDYLALKNQLPLTPSLNKEGGSNRIPPLFFKEGVRGSSQDINTLGSKIIREIVIPELTREVNEGKNFARLRQVYNSLILADWYKRKEAQQKGAGQQNGPQKGTGPLRSRGQSPSYGGQSPFFSSSILAQLYFNRNKVGGIKISDLQEEKRIYARYLTAFRKGVFNYIKNEGMPETSQKMPRKYFSGGCVFGKVPMNSSSAMPTAAMMANQEILPVNLVPQGLNFAMNASAPETKLGFTEAQNKALVEGCLELEENLKNKYPSLRKYFVSLRNQERFATYVRTKLKEHESVVSRNVLRNLLWEAFLMFYADVIPYRSAIKKIFKQFMSKLNLDVQDFEIRAYFSIKDKIRRGLRGKSPVLFFIPQYGDKVYQKQMDEVARKDGWHVRRAWNHPMVTEQGLVGTRLPDKSGRNVPFALGFLLRVFEEASENSGENYLIDYRNIETGDARGQIQEMLRTGVLEHPVQGKIKVPDNVRLFFSMRDGSDIRDDSFYDRMTVKWMAERASRVDNLVSADEHWEIKDVRIEERDGQKYLVIKNDKIPLSEEFQDLTDENFEKILYQRIRLFLDSETLKMLVFMKRAVERNICLVRLEGPTGRGKTYIASRFARLMGKKFNSYPVSNKSSLGEIRGDYTINAQGQLEFQKQTPFIETMEQGGVFASSEITTHQDDNQEASFMYWQAQINDLEADEDGSRTLELWDVPVQKGEPLHQIKIKKGALIVDDSNPETYSQRGKTPGVIKDATPLLVVKDLVDIENPQGASNQEIEHNLKLILECGFESQALGNIRGLEIAEAQRIAHEVTSVFVWVVSKYLKKEFQGVEPLAFSNRELIRMGEDVLIAQQRGEYSNEKLARILETHLGLCFSTPEAQEKVLDIIKEVIGIPAPKMALKDVLDDQLSKSRVVHVRLGVWDDFKESVGRSLNKDSRRVHYYPLTSETTRYELQGGQGFDLKTGSIATLDGLYGQLIEEANRHPEEEVVYVLENANRLQGSEATSSNEFLQDGVLNVPGSKAKKRLPPNAKIVLVSRMDGQWDWSEA
ncbi:MAG: AAA family ATPase, partial [Candidatus Omnitrophica bacterium]|nr:AAA family ATPase [Candidatus Omnitrophota bacterium]